MNIESFRSYCLAKAGVTEGFPFGETTIVFKVLGKMFALAGIENFKGINLKCDPTTAIELRERYNAVTPAYHMNKVHWNTVSVDEDVSDKMIFSLIDDSYNLVVAKLSKKQKDGLRT